MHCPHCKTEIDEHEAGRCLDAWVAEAVMGAKWTEQENVCRILWNADGVEMIMEEWSEKDWVPSTASLPQYSTDIAAAWDVVEKVCTWEAEDSVLKLRGQGPSPEILDEPDGWYDVELGRRSGSAATAPLAICRAALDD